MGKDLTKSKTTFYFCDGGSCRKAGGESSLREARAHLRNKGWWDSTHTIKTRCNGRCEDAPTWIVHPGNFWYKEVSPAKAISIINEHCNHHQPLRSELIFEEGMDYINSEKERPPVATPVFEPKEDEVLGNVFRARGSHSDQYLYPLFLYLSKNPGKTTLSIPGQGRVYLSELKGIDYTDPYRLRLRFDEGGWATVELVIALIPKTEPESLQQNKITICEYFIQIATDQKVIRMKNRGGKVVAELVIANEDHATWEYCMKIQLNGAEEPKIVIDE